MGERMKRMVLYLPKKLHEDLLLLSEEDGRSYGELIRGMVADYIEAHSIKDAINGNPNVAIYLTQKQRDLLDSLARIEHQLTVTKVKDSKLFYSLNQIKDIPKVPGCYAWILNGEILRVGQSINLHARVKNYFKSDDSPSVALIDLVLINKEKIRISIWPTNRRIYLENCLLAKYHPRFNCRGGTWKIVEKCS